MSLSRHGGPTDVPAGYDPSRYDRPSVTVDMLIFTVMDNDLKALLIRRKHPPCAGRWAFPGGFVDMHESLETAAVRELKEETGLDNPTLRGHMEQLHTFGDPARDPRTRVITVAYMALIPPDELEPKGGDDAAEAAWHSAINPPELAFDHEDILTVAKDRLREMASSTTLPFHLLPECFTLHELQVVYELLLECNLDKRNFHRRIRSMVELKTCEQQQTYRRGRPARIFRLASKKIKSKSEIAECSD